MKTLTATGINKMATRFMESIDHIEFKADDIISTATIDSYLAIADTIKAYFSIPDEINGTVSDIKLIDKDGDVIALILGSFAKLVGKKMLIKFSYKIEEMEVMNIE